MGMFDYVKCNYPLPRPEDVGVEFQTKTFEDPFMQHYEISTDGRLLLQIVNYEDRSDKTAEPGSFASLRGCMTPVPTGEMRDMDWHGYVEFGDYRAKFTDGKLLEVKLDMAGRGPEQPTKEQAK